MAWINEINFAFDWGDHWDGIKGSSNKSSKSKLMQCLMAKYTSCIPAQKKEVDGTDIIQKTQTSTSPSVNISSSPITTKPSAYAIDVIRPDPLNVGYATPPASLTGR